MIQVAIPPRTVQFVDKPPSQMTESAPRANAPLTKLLSKTVGSLKVISVAADTFRVKETGLHYTESVDGVTQATVNAKPNDVTEQNLCISSTENDWNEDRTDENNDMPNKNYRTNEDGAHRNGA